MNAFLPEIAVQGCLPKQVESSLLHALCAVAPSLLTRAALVQVRQIVRSRQIPHYQQDWAAFAYLYFPANFAKAYLAARHIVPSTLAGAGTVIEVVDLGCGGGASLIGTLLGLRSSGATDAVRIGRVIAVDRSEEQLRLFDAVARPWIAQEFPDVAVDTRRQDVFDFLKERSSNANIVIAAYLASELSPARNEEFRSLLRSRCAAGKVNELLLLESDPLKRGLTIERYDGSVIFAPYDAVRLDLSFLDTLGLNYAPKSRMLKKAFSGATLTLGNAMTWNL